MSEHDPTQQDPQFLVQYRTYVESLAPPPVHERFDEEVAAARLDQLSVFANAGERRAEGWTEAVEPPPFPGGFIRPHWIDRTPCVMDAAAARTSSTYPRYTQMRHVRPGTSSPEVEWSNKWDRLYGGLVRKFHAFHLTFLEQVVGTPDPAELREAFATITASCAADLQQLAGIHQGHDKFDVGPLTRYPEWLTSSVMNVLFASPDEGVTAEHQQKALQLLASLNDTETDIAAKTLDYVGTHDKASEVIMRLPHRMQDEAERRQTTHPDWRRNPIIQKYLGPEARPVRFDVACKELITKAPRDALQVMLLSLRGPMRPAALHMLREIGRHPNLLDAIVREDGSYREVHEDPASLANITVEGSDDISRLTRPELVERLRAAQLNITGLRGALSRLQDQSDRDFHRAEMYEVDLLGARALNRDLEALLQDPKALLGQLARIGWDTVRFRRKPASETPEA